MEEHYRVGEVARLTGVSIRTLHHYDHLGLLAPSGHSEAGYRLYARPDLLRLQQILTLRYLGFPLAQIGDLLARPDFDVASSLRIQREILRDRIAELSRIDEALSGLMAHYQAVGEWDWRLVTSASLALHDRLDRKEDTTSDYYTPEEMSQAMENVGQRVTPEEIKEVEDDWTALIAEVRANHHLDPSSARAQELAHRWKRQMKRINAYYQEDPKLLKTIGRNYRQGKYAGVPQAPTKDDIAFIEAAIKAGM